MTEDYIRNAVVVKILDGDTIDVSVDLGYHLTTSARLRFNRINAPEMNTAAGKAAKAFIMGNLKVGDPVTIQTHKDPTDKYGRWLAEIWLSDGRNLNTLMLEQGHAQAYS